MGPDPHEPIHDIAHLGSVELLTPKFDRSLWYFRDVLGMEVVHSAGDYASTALKLTAADHAGLGAGWNEGEFGRGRSYRFRDPEGHVMEVYYDEPRNRAPDHLRSTLKNLPMRYSARGANVRRVGPPAPLLALGGQPRRRPSRRRTASSNTPRQMRRSPALRKSRCRCSTPGSQALGLKAASTSMR